MSLITICPACGKQHKALESLAGRRVKCLACGQAFKVPGPAASAKPAPAKGVQDQAVAAVQATPPPADEILDAVAVPEEPVDVIPVAEAATPVKPLPQRTALPFLKHQEFLIAARSSSAFALDYHIVQPVTCEELAFSREESDSGRTVLQVLGADRASFASTVTFFDSRTERVAFTVLRQAFRKFIGLNPVRVDLHDGGDRLLGWFEAKVFPATGVVSIYDGQDRKCAELEGKWHPQPDYGFYAKGGSEMGVVAADGTTRKLFTSALSWCKRGGQLLLSLDGKLAAQPETKLLLLGTTLAMEMLVGSMRIPVGR